MSHQHHNFMFKVNQVMPEFETIDDITKNSDLIEFAARIKTAIIQRSDYTNDDLEELTREGKLIFKFRGKKVLVRVNDD